MKIRKIVGDSDEQLLGGNFLNNTSGSYSSLSTFKLETNFTGKINTNYDNVLTSFSNPISLDTIKLNEVDSEMISTDQKVKLNFDKSDLKSYIGFGSVVDYMKSAIHNIILDYPASLYVDSEEFTINPRNTVADYIPNIYLNTSKLKIYSTFIKNKFGLIYNKDNSNIPDDNELRNLNLSYSDYVIYYNNVEYNIISFIGSYNGLVEMEVEGLPFGEDVLVLTNRTFHIKPKPLIFNKIRKKMGNLERYFLQNRLLDNSGFQITIKEPFFMDDGRITYQDRILLWSTSDGYNVDYEGGSFNAFVSSLINISENYDNTKTDLINRFLTPPSLKIYDNTQDRKIEKLLRIWGRNFDEVKQYIDALTKINKLSYDKQNNIPDVLVKNLARTFGWDDITLVKDDDIINNFFAVDYEENKTDMLPVEIDIELWRRILINTNFFWKTKGTRQAILAIFKLIGIPEPFVNIKEYIYTVDEVINPDDVDLSLEDLYSSSLPYNKNGYPIAPTETNDFFFQISGNTDNGQHYMNNFRKSGFVLNQIEDNKKSWVYSGETIREHGSTVQYYQESSDLVLNTKQVDISLDIANAVEYDVFDYIKNVDYPNNSPDYAKKFTFVNINTDFEISNSSYELPEEPVGDVQISLNGITLTNSTGGGINIEGDYYIDENNSKLIHLNTNINNNDVIVVSYLFRENSNDENSELLSQTIKYVLTQAFPNSDGNMITLPDQPNGDVQVILNGISLSRSDNNFVGEYIINPNNTQQIFIINDTFKNMIVENNNIIQLSYLTSETGYDLNQRSEFYKINSFNTDKLFFNTQINRFVYKLNIKVNNVNDIRLTLNGITLSPENEYQLSTIDKSNILLPPQIQLGDVLGFYYVKSESGENDLAVPDAFGVGDISKLSFLEFIDLLEKKLINVKNRKVITDNKGGFYPTLLRVYMQYLKRSKLDDDNILQSNGYTYDNLYEFLNKYNSFFYNFTEKLLPATVIHGKGGFLNRNSVFSKQKFTYKRGVALNIVDDMGVPNTDLNWLGTDGAEFRVLQSGGAATTARGVLTSAPNNWTILDAGQI